METTNPLVAFIIANPNIASILVIIGTLRMIIKPLMSFIHEFVRVTPSKSDNELLEKIEKSIYWKIFVYLLDWFGSIKLPKKPDLL